MSASERATTTQMVAGTELEIDYGRPSLRGRGGPLGEIVEWDDTWTGGANASTKLRTSKDVVLGGVPVPAGLYSVWLEVIDAPEWRVMLHSDTTLFHVPHPPIDSAEIVIRATREQSPEVVETLEWRFEGLRWNGGTLAMAWGEERIRVPLEVDPGFELTVDPEEAARYAGRWVIDDTASRPSAERIERMLGDEDVTGATRRYFEAMRDMPDSRVVEIVHDPESGRLYRVDPILGPIYAEFYGTSTDDLRLDLLLERAEGVFMRAQSVGGELMSFDPEGASFFEFTFDDTGRAISFELRDSEDEVGITGVREGG